MSATIVFKRIADGQLRVEKLNPVTVVKERVIHYGVVAVSAVIGLRGHRVEVTLYFAVNGIIWLLNLILPHLGLQELNRRSLLKMDEEAWLVKTSGNLLLYVRPWQSDISIQSDYFEHRLRSCLEGIESGTFVDIGAHIGKFTLLVAKRVGSKGRVIAIEPEKDNFIMLKRNIEANQLDNVLSLNVACFSEDTTTRLYVSDESGGHSLKELGSDYQIVRACKLDSLVQELGLHGITAIKIDVEDTEINVLEGAEQTLSAYHPQVLFESRSGTAFEQCAAFLCEFGYNIRQIDHRNYLATQTS